MPPSASHLMSNFAINLASQARSKLHSALGSGSRDNLSLHRWVLLKNSITRDDFVTPPPASAAVASELPEPDFDDEDEVDSYLDESMFAFLFPDPGDGVASPDNRNVSEAQWLDSLLETLGDDEDSDEGETQVSVRVIPVDQDTDHYSQSEFDSPESSFNEDFAIHRPIAVPYPVPYPPYHPPLDNSFDLDTPNDCCLFSSHRIRDCSPYFAIDDSDSSVPDAIEDNSDDESDAPTTPSSRSRSSLSLIDPASIPLPRERHEPHIYNASDEFFPFDVASLPYSDPNSDSIASAYSPFHQNC